MSRCDFISDVLPASVQKDKELSARSQKDNSMLSSLGEMGELLKSELDSSTLIRSCSDLLIILLISKGPCMRWEGRYSREVRKRRKDSSVYILFGAKMKLETIFVKLIGNLGWSTSVARYLCRTWSACWLTITWYWGWAGQRLSSRDQQLRSLTTG